MSRCYHVQTAKFGTVGIIADNIEDARRYAKAAFGVGPDQVSRAPSQGDRCNECDSAPCVCVEA